MTDKFKDLPFMYSAYYDASTITQAPNQTIQLLMPAQFKLRRALWQHNLQAGPDNSFSSLQIYDRNNRSLTGLLGTPSAVVPLGGKMRNAEFIIAPESVFEPGDALHFDFTDFPVDPQTPANQKVIVFQGVHSSNVQVNPSPVRKGNWLERPYQYILNVSMSNVADSVAYFSQTQNYQIEIRDYDFELRRILIVDTAKTDDAISNGTVGYSMGGLFAYILQNANSQALSNGPIPDWALGANCNFFANCFPVPAIIYPLGSLIRLQAFNIWQQLSAAGTNSVSQQVIFDGVQRFPCGG